MKNDLWFGFIIGFLFGAVAITIIFVLFGEVSL